MPQPNNKDESAVWEMIGFIACLIALIVLFLMAYERAYGMDGDVCLTVKMTGKDVLYNYDGDTYAVDFGKFGQWYIREEGVDTPERTKKQKGWEEAKNYTWAWLYAGPFELKTCFDLTLGRVVGSSSRDGETLAHALIIAGHQKVK